MRKEKPSKVLSVLQKFYEPIPIESFRKNPYKILVFALLSSRTKDETTYKASLRLFKKAPTIFDLENLSEEKIRSLIFPVGFYRTKAKFLKKISQMIIKQFSGKIPRERSQLMRLPGVGRKTANLILSEAFSAPTIAVDTHVHRISNLLSLVNTKKPEDTEKQLKKIFPRKDWNKINKIFVSIGRRFNSREKLINFFKKQGLL